MESMEPKLESVDPPSPRRGSYSKAPIARNRGSINRGDDKSARTSYSCAECKRLKLKCSRAPWPCTSCERRGCGDICPSGEMRAYKKGKYMVMAGSEDLHNRIDELETALRAAHKAAGNKEPHQLLRETHFYTTAGATAKEDEKVESAFGLLKIGSEGESRYVGPAAGSEYLQEAGIDTEDYENESTPAPEDRDPRGAYAEGALNLMDSYLTAGPAHSYTVEQLKAQLPDWEAEGAATMESYWENVNWMYQVVPRTMFEQDHFPSTYHSLRPHPHKLACVFFMLALGDMFDLRKRPWDGEAKRLFLHGRFALSLIGLENATPATVQAIHLMGTFILNDGLGNGADIFWPILGTATRVAQSLGLHRDGMSFGLSPYEVTERRQVYWEILTYDRLQALCFGRPCAFQNRASDTQYPTDIDWIPDEDGFHLAKYKLMSMMERVIDIQTCATPVKYHVVVELDKTLQEFRSKLPPSLLSMVAIPDLPLDRNSSPQFVIHRFGIRLLVAQTRLLLNRHWIMRAIALNPRNPRDTIFAEAFIATYESAQEVVQVVKQLVLYHPALIARWWFFWFHAISAAVVLGAVAIQAPSSPFASPAFTGLSHVVTICEAAGKGFRAKTALPFIQGLRDRAGAALSRAAQQRQHSSHGKDAVPSETGLSHLDSTAKLVRVGSEPRMAEPSPIDTSVPPQTEGYSSSAIPQYMQRWDTSSPTPAGVVDALLEQQQQHNFPPGSASERFDTPSINYADNWFNPAMPWNQPSGSNSHTHSASGSVDFAHSQPHNVAGAQSTAASAPSAVPLGVFQERLAMDNDLSVAMGLEGNGDSGLYFTQFVDNLSGRGPGPNA